MKALIHHSFGNPAEVLTVEDVATPEPRPGEARVRLTLAAIHNHDLWTVAGTYGYRPSFPARSGTEAVSVVEGVEHLQPGMRVATGGTFGVWAEQFVAKPASCQSTRSGVHEGAATRRRVQFNLPHPAGTRL
ncbi:alcohol dehydrogenase catalytic domain-containing protein [Demequina lignilytica]|uniref:alcohol dehydrogenase catalytic domain-containing protein n=1 Tax=Demequina lignilytica TaxID=3051663 RepID=UPI00345D1390